MADFLPAGDPEFDIWFTNFVQYIALKTSGNNPEWKHIPKERVDELNAAHKRWSAAYALCGKPHTEVETGAKNDARVYAESVIRPFKKNFIDERNEVSDPERIAMRVPLRRKTRVSGVEPLTYPILEAVSSIIRELLFRYRDSGTGSRAKPRGVHGMEFRWEIRDTSPANVEELANVDFFTSAPFTLKFTEAGRGKRVYFCARWESNTGKKGPWSTIGQAIIP